MNNKVLSLQYNPDIQEFSENSENIQHAESFFKIRHWSQNTLSINAAGHLEIEIEKDVRLDLFKLAETLSSTGDWPVLLRFPALISRNVSMIHEAFHKIMAKFQYPSQYILAYPLKVNPHAGVVNAILSSPHAPNTTFEVGSKAELLIALAYTTPHQRIMCNGFKDKAYLDLVIESAKNGQSICLVFETIDEISELLDHTRQLPSSMDLGVRLRLTSSASGHWEDSNGKHSKFGLSSTEAIQTISMLKKQQLLTHLNTLHIHPGSQVTAIEDLRQCFKEFIRYYHELLKLDVPLQYVDIGGGLAMDYSGAEEETLRDYTLEDYAAAIVEPMAGYCREHGLSFPHILSETGRNTVAHSTMLLTDIKRLGNQNIEPITRLDKKHSPSVQQLWELHHFISSFQNNEPTSAANVQLDHLLKTIRQEFLDNQLSLAELAWSEKTYMQCQTLLHGPADYQKYIANFSVFQSLPDYWGIDQFIPSLSLHGYEHPLTRSGVFYDLTCDSDGVIDYYLHPRNLQSKLSMPNCDVSYIGFFLVGAYQEIMASGHNLFERLLCLDIVFNPETQMFEAYSYQPCSVADSLEEIGYEKTAIAQQMNEKFTAPVMKSLVQKSLSGTSYMVL